MAGDIDGSETVKGNNEWVVSDGSTREAYSCPSFRKFLEGSSDKVYGWGNNIADHYPIGYGYNAHLSKFNTWNDSQGCPTSTGGWSFAGKDPRSDTLVLIDAASFFLSNSPGGSFYPVYDINPRYVNYNGSIAGAHSGGFANSLWADMHVEARRADEYSELFVMLNNRILKLLLSLSP